MHLSATVTMKGNLFEGNAPEIINRNLTSAMYEAVAFLERKVKEKTPQGVGGAQGGLRSRIGGEIVGKGTPVLKGIVAHQSPYGDVIERGRTAGKTWPPKGALIQWIEQKLGVHGAEAQRVEFLVRRKIGKKGFPGARMFEQTWDRYFPDIQAMFERAGFNIVKDLNK